jgi:hypothetical protein
VRLANNNLFTIPHVMTLARAHGLAGGVNETDATAAINRKVDLLVIIQPKWDRWNNECLTDPRFDIAHLARMAAYLLQYHDRIPDSANNYIDANLDALLAIDVCVYRRLINGMSPSGSRTTTRRG